MFILRFVGWLLLGLTASLFVMLLSLHLTFDVVDLAERQSLREMCLSDNLASANRALSSRDVAIFKVQCRKLIP